MQYPQLLNGLTVYNQTQHTDHLKTKQSKLKTVQDL